MIKIEYIFFSGVHGVGKSTLTSKIIKDLPAISYSVSDLIRKSGKNIPIDNKNTENIKDNQSLWVQELQKINTDGKMLFLDGHFVLLNEHEEISLVDFEDLFTTNMKKIVLLKCNPTVLVERIFKRDGKLIDLKKIEEFQLLEENQAIKYSASKSIPLFIYENEKQFKDLITFITE